ncbi:hypothetical protein RAS1_30450 [Phycisphaerae bacterium RAS1]|nr:hypothetical protein RAS1_30450 [Phycisphaerae bacterium RAS1]
MARVRRIVNLSDYRSALAGNDEILIGASVRRRRRRQVAISLSGVALIAAAVWLYWALAQPSAEAPPNSYPVKVMCIACKAVETRRVRPGDSFPLICSFCQQRGAKALVVCRDCREEFVPTGEGEMIRCPRCGGTRVGSAASQPVRGGRPGE